MSRTGFLYSKKKIKFLNIIIIEYLKKLFHAKKYKIFKKIFTHSTPSSTRVNARSEVAQGERIG